MKQSSKNLSSKALLLFLSLSLDWLLPCSSLALSVGRNNNPRDKASFVRRRQQSRPKSSGKRTPRWEQEGDLLYQEIPIDRDRSVISYEEACEQLKELEQRPSLPKQSTPHPAKETSVMKAPPPHLSWGNLPVGPILKKQLEAAQVNDPTPIQEASFPILSKGNRNAVIASPTGTGKTLAYLVPLLATKSRSIACQIVIVTPTVELAYQIQSEVDRCLWPPVDGLEAVHVVGSADHALLVEPILACPILCGTPRKIRDLLQQSRTEHSPLARQLAQTFQSNLKTIVLDEADRLLRTEGNARNWKETGQRKKPAPTQTQVLLSQLGNSNNLDKYQLICASATVGRTLRRQLQELTQAPSIDKASEVITADTRATGKSVDKRRAALLPDTISHACVLLPETKTKEDSQVLETLTSVMEGMKPVPSIVFPGKWGVKQVQSHLQETLDAQNVLSIDNIQNINSPEEPSASWQTTPIYVVPDKFARGLDIANVQQVFLLRPPSSAAGYLHLAGRTGRNGQEGQAITLLHPTEVARLATIAERVGVSFQQLQLEKKALTAEEETLDEPTVTMTPSTNESWAHMSDSQLSRKTVAELKQYVEDNEIQRPNLEAGKRILKADLIAAIIGSA